MASTGRLQTEARLIDDLVEDVVGGVVRIPSFQRGLKWQRSDVIRLFDSISRGYPIGNLLLWRRAAPRADSMKIGALTINAPETEAALYVVDGQQRLTSLANALTDEGQRDPRFALAYDLQQQKFVEMGDKSPFVIPLPVVFDLSRLLGWFGQRPELASQSELVRRANDLAKSIRDFRVPVYVVEQSDEDVLRDIFDRMNNYGRKLTRAEVFSALNDVADQSTSKVDGQGDLAAIAAEIHSVTGFGVLDDNTILLAMLARRGPNISREIRKEFERSSEPERSMEEFPNEDAHDARAELVLAMTRAIRFLQEEASMPHFSFLPYRYLMVVLARFYAHFPSPSAASERNLRRWFWRAAVLGPQVTKGNITAVTRTMCYKIVPGNETESVQGLIDSVNVGPAPQMTDVDTFRTNHAVSRVVVSSLWALRPMELTPEFGDSAEYTTDQLLDLLGEGGSALPVAPPIFDEVSITERSLPANRLIVAEDSQSIPEDLGGALEVVARAALAGDDAARRIARSHACSDEALAALVAPDVSAFLGVRQATVNEVVRSFVSRQAEWSFEDTPSLDSLAVDEEAEERRDDEFGDS